MTGPTPSARHRIYLLSVWCEDEGEPSQPQLRFRLEDPRTSQRYGFDGLEAFAAFLETCLTRQDDNDKDNVWSE